MVSIPEKSVGEFLGMQIDLCPHHRLYDVKLALLDREGVPITTIMLDHITKRNMGEIATHLEFLASELRKAME
jgi:hypothetical protein